MRAFRRTGVPIVFLPGGLHLPTIPPHRKVNSIDLGTADKVSAAGDARLVGLTRRGQIRSLHIRRRRNRHGVLGDHGCRERTTGRRGCRNARPDRSSITRKLGRRGRLVARTADQERLVPRRRGRPGHASSQRLSRIAGEALGGPASGNAVRADLSFRARARAARRSARVGR